MLFSSCNSSRSRVQLTKTKPKRSFFFIPSRCGASLFHCWKVVFSHLISRSRGWAEDATRERLPSWISPTEIERSEPSVMFDALFIAHCSSRRSFYLLFISFVRRERERERERERIQERGGYFWFVLNYSSHSVISSDFSASPTPFDSGAKD